MTTTRELPIQLEQCKPTFLPENALRECGTELIKVYNDVKILNLKVWTYHVNVLGPRAFMYCNLFKDVSHLIWLDVERIARQIRAYGIRVPWIQEVINNTRIDLDKEGDWPSEHDMLCNILTDFENLLKYVPESRRKVEKIDPVLEDFLSDVEKRFRAVTFKLRAHAQDVGGKGKGMGVGVGEKAGTTYGKESYAGREEHPGTEFAQQGKKGEPIETQRGKQPFTK